MKLRKELIEIPVEIFKDIIIEPCIEINEGLKIIAPNESNCIICMFELSKDKFINYDFEGIQKFKIQMDLFNKVLKRIKIKNININFENEKIIIADEDNKKSYEIAVMHDEDGLRESPEIPLDKNFKMESAKLKELLDDALIVSDACKIETKENKLIINSGQLNKHSSEIDVQFLERVLLDIQHHINEQG